MKWGFTHSLTHLQKRSTKYVSKLYPNYYHTFSNHLITNSFLNQTKTAVSSSSCSSSYLLPSKRFFHITFLKRQPIIDEPQHVMEDADEPTYDPKDIQMSYLSEETRDEIWNLHKSNPEIWTESTLSEKYRATRERIKAVLYLRRTREEHMIANGVFVIHEEWHRIWHDAISADGVAAIVELLEEEEEEEEDELLEELDEEEGISDDDGEEEDEEGVSKPTKEIKASDGDDDDDEDEEDVDTEKDEEGNVLQHADEYDEDDDDDFYDLDKHENIKLIEIVEPEQLQLSDCPDNDDEAFFTESTSLPEDSDFDGAVSEEDAVDREFDYDYDDDEEEEGVEIEGKAEGESTTEPDELDLGRIYRTKKGLPYYKDEHGNKFQLDYSEESEPIPGSELGIPGLENFDVILVDPPVEEIVNADTGEMSTMADLSTEEIDFHVRKRLGIKSSFDQAYEEDVSDLRGFDEVDDIDDDDDNNIDLSDEELGFTVEPDNSEQFEMDMETNLNKLMNDENLFAELEARGLKSGITAGGKDDIATVDFEGLLNDEGVSKLMKDTLKGIDFKSHMRQIENMPVFDNLEKEVAYNGSDHYSDNLDSDEDLQKLFSQMTKAEELFRSGYSNTITGELEANNNNGSNGNGIAVENSNHSLANMTSNLQSVTARRFSASLKTQDPSYPQYLSKEQIEAESEKLEKEMFADDDPTYGAALITQLAKNYRKTPQEITHILERMLEHHMRTANMLDAEADFMDEIEEAEAAGVNINFQEPNENIKESAFDSKYFPSLIEDDAFEDTKNALYERIERETKADVPATVRGFTKRDPTVPGSAQSTRTEPLKIIPEIAIVEQHRDEIFSRWKFAFRDLTSSAVEEKRPTMIRTRTGKWREATPLEEFGRSWRRKPDGLEWGVHGHLLDKYKDPDGDEERARLASKLKKERVKALKAQYDAQKELEKALPPKIVHKHRKEKGEKLKRKKIDKKAAGRLGNDSSNSGKPGFDANSTTAPRRQAIVKK